MKCNTKSSTETELILLADKLADVIWMQYIIECQGYDIDKYVVFQDNMSALLLEKNGCISSSKQTKHIKAKYFLIKDYYDAGEIDVEFCPTDEMWADVLTKLLQEQKFRDMCAFLQNCPQDYDDDTEFKISMKPQDVASSRECVVEYAKLKTKLKTKQSANHEPQAPHAYHESHGDQHKSHGSQMNPTRDPTKNPTKTIGPRDPTNIQNVIGGDRGSAGI
jgi:hypothetical protein